VQRDIFPLPLVEETGPNVKKLSRGCSQRLGTKRHRQKEVNHCISSLNQLFGTSVPGDRVQQRRGQTLPNLAQVKSLEFIEDCIEEMGPPGPLSGPEALEALRVAEGY
jgi:hypothetical protein